jgi:putative two-component system response regulator
MIFDVIPSILAIDDNGTNLQLLQGMFQEHYKVYMCPSGERALAFLEKTLPDLILLDIEMPGMDGYEVMAKLRAVPRTATVPVIFLTGHIGEEHEVRALDMGAQDYIPKPFVVQVVLARVKHQLELALYRKQLENMVRQKTAQVVKMQDIALGLLATATEYRDMETGGHIQRTTRYVHLLLEALEAHPRTGYTFDPAYAEYVFKTAKLHDIGKIGVPDAILLKPGALSPPEFDIIKKHTLIGAEMLQSGIESMGEASLLDVALEIAMNHHEKWDGSGYPQGLKGEGIPLSGRIMAIADVYDALISARPYKAPFSHREAKTIIEQGRGSHFDPYLVDLFVARHEQFEEISVSR